MSLFNNLNYVLVVLLLSVISVATVSCSNKKTPAISGVGSISDTGEVGKGKGEWEPSGGNNGDAENIKNESPNPRRSSSMEIPPYEDIMSCDGVLFSLPFWNYFKNDNFKGAPNKKLISLNKEARSSLIYIYQMTSRFQIDRSLIHLTEEEVLRAVINKVKKFSPDLALELKNRIHEFKLNVWTEKSDNLTGITRDEIEVEFNEYCKSQKLINKKIKILDDESIVQTLEYDKALFLSMSGSQQAMITLREVLHLMSGTSRDQESNKINKFVSFLMSTNTLKFESNLEKGTVAFEILTSDILE